LTGQFGFDFNLYIFIVLIKVNWLTYFIKHYCKDGNWKL